MHVSVEQTGSLERRITVQVPAERVEDEVASRLRRLAGRVKMDGFRPGKVPFKMVQRKYDQQVRSEVVSELMRETLQQAIRQEDLHPAGGPRLEPKTLEPGKALEYSATFEVYPKIELAPLSSITIERPVVEITDQDVDHMLDRLRAQRTTWQAVQREAREGDQVLIDFEGTADGQPFSGNKGEQVPVVLGSGSMVEGFEEQLAGAAPGEHRTIEVHFPQDYRGEEVAGRTAVFEVDVASVSEPKVPEIDEDFARGFGVPSGDVAELRAEVRNNMARELEQTVRSRLKQQAMDALLEANAIEVPKALVEEEIDRAIQQALKRRPESMRKLNLPREVFEESARRRVALGLLMGEVIRAGGIELDAARVGSTLESVASTYENPEQIKEMYTKTPSLRRELEGHVLEEQVVDYLLEQAVVQDKPMVFDELMNAADRG
ncbi:MAG: trigger factor [Gammaproteobacteria bacterium]|nr:trigger factor [Gammaproteobacteria bacterium]NIR96970.1 trigger factor [Gammaproteobacteria bacterium]NIT62672.1 trigger factor [Gammaproteobacteria bacterium]NIV19632.1 trigger factor [Gammaproteobacteria bacterium]NIX10852.1 trigger factor [Gammaproteobacteria bacterium]